MIEEYTYLTIYMQGGRHESMEEVSLMAGAVILLVVSCDGKRGRQSDGDGRF
jgi:hypothetical protein